MEVVSQLWAGGRGNGMDVVTRRAVTEVINDLEAKAAAYERLAALGDVVMQARMEEVRGCVERLAPLGLQWTEPRLVSRH